MKFNNTTDIPTRVILESMLFSIQDGVSIDEVVIRNKKDGIVHGQWGWYFPSEKKIVLVVPTHICNYISRKKYTRLPFKHRDRIDFVYAIMAHELRHAWQWQVSKKNLGRSRFDLVMREADAETYETEQLQMWQRQTDVNVMRAASFQP